MNLYKFPQRGVFFRDIHTISGIFRGFTMSLAQKSFVTAAVAPFLLAFGLAAANADCLPGVYDAQRGVKMTDCYTTAEINKAMPALGQKTRIVADRIAVGENANGEIQTSALHNRWTSSDDGKLGFNLEGDAPTGQPQNEWRIRTAFKDVQIWDRNQKAQPSAELVGAVLASGIAKSGDRLMLSGKNGNGYQIVVAHSFDPTVGSFMVGNNVTGAGLATMKNLDYAPGGRAILAQQHASPH